MIECSSEIESKHLRDRWNEGYLLYKLSTKKYLDIHGKWRYFVTYKPRNSRITKVLRDLQCLTSQVK